MTYDDLQKAKELFERASQDHVSYRCLYLPATDPGLIIEAIEYTYQARCRRR